MLTLSNIYYAIQKNAVTNDYILYTAPMIILLLMSVIFLFMKSWICHGILYLIAGLSFVFLGSAQDVGATVFIYLSLLCFNKNTGEHKKLIYPIVLTVFFFMVFLKFAVFCIPLIDIAVVSIFYSGAYGISYLINKQEGGNNGDRTSL